MEALEVSLKSDAPFTLLLLDCRMPGMDGFEVIERIHADPRLSNLTIIMLASDRWADDIAKTYDLGLGGYLSLIHISSAPPALKSITLAFTPTSC